jgi:hypothetical protein
MAIKFHPRLLLLGGLTLAAATATAFVPPIPQPDWYHDFADQRSFFGIPNSLDVVSNLPFIVVGVYGLIALYAKHSRITFIGRWERISYAVLFFGALLTGFGSAYYHWAPDNDTLVWDRMPMTIMFMAFLTTIISERIGWKSGRLMLFPLLILGLASVVYWNYTEQIGAGDLRFYGFIHFFPVVLIAMMLWLYPPRYTRGSDILVVFLFYGLATIFELLDRQVFALSNVISGHTIKHLLAVAAIYWLWRMLKKRKPAGHAPTPFR